MNLRALIVILLAGVTRLSAETVIEIGAHIADVPRGTKAPETPAALAKRKNIHVIAPGRVGVSSGATARIEVNQPTTTPRGATVDLGLTVEIVPVLTEQGTISFSGTALDRAYHGKREGAAFSAMEFATREVHFQGSAPNGGTVLIQTAPIIEGKGAKDAAGQELLIYLSFTKKTVQPPKSPAKTTKTIAKSKSSSAKSGAKKKTTGKK